MLVWFRLVRLSILGQLEEAAVSELNDFSPSLVAGGRIERALGNAVFQRRYAITTSVVGIFLTVGIISAWIFIPPWPEQTRFLWSTLAGATRSLEDIMMLLMVFIASLLGMYLSLRGSGRPLARLLASSSGSIAVGLGLFRFLHATLPLWPLKQVATENLALGYLLVAAFLLMTVLMAVWMFSTLKFLLFFPKPVKLAGIDPLADQNLGERWRTRQGRGFWFGDSFNWRCLVSPQFAALVAGMTVILLVDFQAERMTGGVFFDTTSYLWCWIPFAFISAKHKHVDDEDRRAIHWVTLGQSIWLALFLVSLFLLFFSRAAGILEFTNWAQSNDFTGALMRFYFYGFVTVLLVTLAFSILYHGTLDPALVIRRTWVLALVSILSGMLFVAVERFAADLLTRWLDMSAGTAFTFVGIFTAACIFPLRTWAERFIKRVMQRWQSTYLLADGAREEAVIVFADLSGYTALTEKSEREALILAAIFHRDADRLAEAHRGRLIKTIGDAVMLRFRNVDDAYAATRKLIDEYTNHATPLVSVPLPIHAAIHLGEVVEGTNGDVFGATVNLAARLLGAAGPHEVVASQAAVDKLTEKAQAETMGNHTFKNVENPVMCFRLAMA